MQAAERQRSDATAGGETAPGDREVRQRLARARVLIVGAGGLGSPAALQLAAAGVGTLVIIDPDAVELSNLHRQIVHRTADLGTPKVESARARLGALHPEVTVEARAERLDAQNLPRLFRDVDFVIDGTDGVAAKFLVNDGAVRTGRPFSHAGILGFVGQTMTVLPGRSACYRCLFPEPPPADTVPTCQEAGIVGAVAGAIGSVQAAEAVKFLLGRGDLLADRLLTYHALSRRWRTVALARNPRCPVCRAQPDGAALAAAGGARYGVNG